MSYPVSKLENQSVQHNQITTDKSVNIDRLRLLFRQSSFAALISVVVSSFLAVILWEAYYSLELVLWLVLLQGSSAWVLILTLLFKRSSPQGEAVLNWERLYFYSVLFAASSWGLGAVYMLQPMNIIYQLVIYTFLLGMAGGALSVFSAVRYFSISMMCAVFLPVTFMFLFLDTLIHQLLGAAGVVFLLSGIHTTKILSESLHKSLQLNYELDVAREKAEWMARVDMLTGLNNRFAFMEHSSLQNNYCRRNNLPVSVLIFDVDDFKDINDTYGHDAGDLALIHLSMQLRKIMRDSDVCGRFGGEEFIVFLPDTDSNRAAFVAEKIRVAIHSISVSYGKKTFSISVSVGGATGCHDLDALVKLADTCLYQAKRSGKNQCVITLMDEMVENIA